jgi:hypothetical protein
MPTENILAAIKATVFSKYEETTTLLNKKDKKLTLIETHQDAECTKIDFEITNDILVYKFDKVVHTEKGDKIEHHLLFLEKDTPIRTTCDYILFYLKKTKKGGNKLYVIICNMKSKTKGNMEQQMSAGVILGEFIAKTAFRCHNNWNSQTGNQLTEDYSVCELAIYSEIPSSVTIPKGCSKPQKIYHKRKPLECNKLYNLDTILSGMF